MLSHRENYELTSDISETKCEVIREEDKIGNQINYIIWGFLKCGFFAHLSRRREAYGWLYGFFLSCFKS